MLACVNLLAMCLSIVLTTASACFARLTKQRFCAAPYSNATLPQTLAFWALWHCRHARPPDTCASR